MLMISIVNHPKHTPQTNLVKDIERELKDECFITYFDVDNITKVILSKILISSDYVLFYTNDVEKLKKLVNKNDKEYEFIKIIRGRKDQNSLKLCKL
jgi:hypothetical protein